MDNILCLEVCIILSSLILIETNNIIILEAIKKEKNKKNDMSKYNFYIKKFSMH